MLQKAFTHMDASQPQFAACRRLHIIGTSLGEPHTYVKLGDFVLLLFAGHCGASLRKLRA